MFLSNTVHLDIDNIQRKIKTFVDLRHKQMLSYVYNYR